MRAGESKRTPSSFAVSVFLLVFEEEEEAEERENHLG